MTVCSKLIEYWMNSTNDYKIFIMDVFKDSGIQALPFQELQKLLSVLESNDPIARALTIKTLGYLVYVSRESKELQHYLLACVKDAKTMNSIELDACIFCCLQLAKNSQDFAYVVCKLMFQIVIDNPSVMTIYRNLYWAFMELRDIDYSLEGRGWCKDIIKICQNLKLKRLLIRTKTILSIKSVIYISDEIEDLVSNLEDGAMYSEIVHVTIAEALIVIALKSPDNFEAKFLSRLFDYVNNEDISIAPRARTCQAVLTIFQHTAIKEVIRKEVKLIDSLKRFVDNTIFMVLSNHFGYCSSFLSLFCTLSKQFEEYTEIFQNQGKSRTN